MDVRHGKEVYILFLSGRSTFYSDVRKVNTDANYSMYQITDVYNRQSFINSKVIERIEFGREVDIIEY